MSMTPSAGTCGLGDRKKMEEQKNQKKHWFDRRRAYLDDYQIDESGKSVYTGNVYDWPEPRKPALIRLWILAGLTFAAQIGAGCIPGVCMNGRAWVLLPYMAALLASLSVLWGCYELTDGGDPLRERSYKKSVEILPFRSVLTGICALLAAAGELINLLWAAQFRGTLFGALCYMITEAAGLLFALLFYLRIRKMEFTIVN